MECFNCVFFTFLIGDLSNLKIIKYNVKIENEVFFISPRYKYFFVNLFTIILHRPLTNFA